MDGVTDVEGVIEGVTVPDGVPLGVVDGVGVPDGVFVRVALGVGGDGDAVTLVEGVVDVVGVEVGVTVGVGLGQMAFSPVVPSGGSDTPRTIVEVVVGA